MPSDFFLEAHVLRYTEPLGYQSDQPISHHFLTRFMTGDIARDWQTLIVTLARLVLWYWIQSWDFKDGKVSLQRE